MQALQQLVRIQRRGTQEVRRRVFSALGEMDSYWKIHSPGNDKTGYVIGLFGSGRGYIIGLIRNLVGRRAKYFTWRTMRVRQIPTSMIYSGHATIRHICRHQLLPAATSRILESVSSRCADLIFVYRHPLDSLLTNWIYWREYLRGNTRTWSVSYVYKNNDALAADLERNFPEFKAFAEGDPSFFASAPGPRFLSFPEFVEETELYLDCATLALRLEDFTIDPVKEFSKLADLMSLGLDLDHLHVPPPNAKPYRYLRVEEKAPRFRHFIDGLDAETIRRIGNIGYKLGG